MTRCMWRSLGLAILLLSAQVGYGEVQHAGPEGFVSAHTLVLPVPPEQAFTALTAQVHLWWDAAHSYGGEAARFSMQTRAGGCFCEDLGAAGSVEHMRVVNVQQGKSITLRGALGPLQGMATNGAMTFRFEPHPEGSELRYRYAVGGYAPGGLERLAGPVDQVQLGQLQRLRDYLVGVVERERMDGTANPD
ncbi:MAG: ATPase [Pseudomonadota bacterium]